MYGTESRNVKIAGYILYAYVSRKCTQPIYLVVHYEILLHVCLYDAIYHANDIISEKVVNGISVLCFGIKDSMQTQSKC